MQQEDESGRRRYRPGCTPTAAAEYRARPTTSSEAAAMVSASWSRVAQPPHRHGNQVIMAVSNGPVAAEQRNDLMGPRTTRTWR